MKLSEINLSELMKVFGPAWLVMLADVDAASIITAMQTGASTKYEFIIVLLLLIIPLYFIQEVAGRVGSVTRKGLGHLIRENFSRKAAILFSFPMAAADFLSYVVNYAGIAIGMSILGVPPIITLPAVYVIHILIVYNKKYASAEKVLLAFSIVMVVAYLVLMSRGISNYPLLPNINSGFFFLLAANVGAVIMPFMLFYQTTATAQKGFHSVQATKIETITGAVASQAIMIAIVIVSSGLSPNAAFSSTHDVASAIMGIGGANAPAIFAIGLVAAGFLALVVISMASAWGVTEALDIKRDGWFKIYIIESLPAVIVPLLYPNLISLTLNLMVALVFVLIGPVIALGLLAQNNKLMGKHTLSTFDKMAFWSSVLVVIVCGLIVFI